MKRIKAGLKEIVAVKCLDCCAGDSVAVLECDSPDCPLLSAKPKSRPDGIKAKYWSEADGRLKALPELRVREVTEEQRRAAGERLAEMRNRKSP